MLNMHPSLKTIALSIASSIAISLPAHAVTVYSYTGVAFDSFINQIDGITYTAIDHVTISLTLSSALPANFSGNINSYLTSYTLSDGNYTVNGSNSTLGSYFFGYPSLTTNASGAVVQWDLRSVLTLAPGEANLISSRNLGSGSVDSGAVTLQCSPTPCNGTLESLGENFGSPGTWQVGAVPEPGTQAMMSLGAIALLIASRRRRTEPQ